MGEISVWDPLDDAGRLVFRSRYFVRRRELGKQNPLKRIADSL